MNSQNSIFDQPLVSILMPAYNCEKFVNEAINSIINQTYRNWELLIADDASTDKTRKIIETYSDFRIKQFHNSENLGYLRTWNKLIAEARGEFITFQDADDYCHIHRIELLIDAFVQNSTISIIGSGIKRVTESNKELETLVFPDLHELIINEFPNKFNFIGSALMIKRKVYDTIGGYHPFFDRMGVEDHYWIIRATEKFKMKNIPNILYYYRFNTHSVSGNISNNPSKINSPRILQILFEQRKRSGTDWLEKGEEKLVHSKLNELNAPFINDPAYFLYYVAKRRFYEGHKKLALNYLFKAICKNPSKYSYYKDFFYFLKS